MYIYNTLNTLIPYACDTQVGYVKNLQRQSIQKILIALKPNLVRIFLQFEKKRSHQRHVSVWVYIVSAVARLAVL